MSVIAPTGEVLRSWGGRGGGPREFRFTPHAPTDRFDIHARIAVAPDGRVYVTDPGNHRIEAFTPEGKLLGEIGSFGNGEDQFLEPIDLVVDDAGNLYVTDGQLSTVSKFSPDGRFQWRIGGEASTDPKLVEPHLASIDPHGRLVIVNGDGTIHYVDGTSLHEVDTFDGGGCNVTVDPLGYTYVHSDANGCEGGTWVFDRAHHLVGQWTGPDNPIGMPPRFGPNGEVFAVGWDGSIIHLDVSIPEE